MRRGGFTLIEILVAMAVLVILAVGVFFSVQNTRNRARNTAILSATRTLAADQVAPLVGKFDSEHRYGGANNPKFFNGQLARNLQRGPTGNVYGYRNPVSLSSEVVSRGAPSDPPPAIYITNRPNFTYDRVVLTQKRSERVQGTIIIWMSNSSPDIEVFYLDTEGERSDFRWTASGP
ncbi:MAG: prepilin-type N-terminal cleavage/methylation domain-containing protein [Candidatus Eremiobacteraeota bacterium]|nr:prepilin-type N-terminal cleavage/methylation domain-containing protein [Candidatus Eremiobacteraeota bacterium]